MKVTTRRGFTLIEVLIAIALVLALVGTMYGFLFNMLFSRARALEHARQQTAADVLIRLLDSDLISCVVGDQASGSGVSGDETHLRVLSRGVAASLAEHGADDPDVFGDLQRTEYRFDSQANRISLNRASVGHATPLAPSPEYPPLEGAIYKLRFRYYDGSTWRSSFDSLTEDHLPVAIEVAIWMRPLPGGSTDQEDFTPPKQELDQPKASADRSAIDDLSPATQPQSSQGDEIAPDRLRVFIIPDGGGDVGPDSSRPDQSMPGLDVEDST